MAKRKRLTPARPDYVAPPAAPETKSIPLPGTPAAAPPISQIAGASATASALEDVTQEMQRIRRDGRLVLSLDLDTVDATHLVRDRMSADADALEALKQSLAARGQQTPIEVVAVGEGYGLISGWRRLTALRALYSETGEARFGQVLALLRQPESAADAYVAMVEENEIRVGLSYYERARIAARATQLGVYPTEKAALQGLFATASRAKRSKIGTFLRLYHVLDDSLHHAAAIPERLGLRLVKALEEEPKLGDRLKAHLQQMTRANAEEELALLESALAGQGADAKPAQTQPQQAPLRIDVETRTREGRGEIVLSGPDVTAAFETELRRWLARAR